MKSRRRSGPLAALLAPIVLVVTILAVTACGGTTAASTTVSQASGSTSATAQPANTKTYTSKTEGYSFLYPKSWEVADQASVGVTAGGSSVSEVGVADPELARGLVRNLRRAGCKEVHLRISCPAHRYPCFYGIDFHKPSELIANKYESLAKVQQYLEVDSLGYLSLNGMLDCLKYENGNYCTACWNGKYPIHAKDVDKFALEMGCATCSTTAPSLRNERWRRR